MILRFLTLVAIAIWFGGFTFYSTAVIDTSQKVLHSVLRSGLITQQVTNWLNVISLPALAVCGANCIGLRGAQSRRCWHMLTASLGGMVLMQMLRCALHPAMDRLIVNREVADGAAFYRLHRFYLVVSTAQWLATLGYVWSTLTLWRSVDQSKIGSLATA